MPERLKETKPKAAPAATARAGAVRKTFVVSDTPAGKAAPRDKAQRITFPGDDLAAGVISKPVAEVLAEESPSTAESTETRKE
jgi:hypothetical protein